MRFKLTAIAIGIMGIFSVPTVCGAFVAGRQCADCHTMHNSQGGLSLTGSYPINTLLVSDCVGCHTGTNDGSNTTPFVYDATAEYSSADPDGGEGVDGNTLAGGNFKWVAQAGGDRKGHNVAGLAAADAVLGMNPPGPSGTPRFSGATQLTCAGTNGCHGEIIEPGSYKAIYGSHHYNVGGTTDGSDLIHSYRLLKGVAGREDSDWEFQPTTTAHNQYKGVVRPQNVSLSTDDSTISSLCGQCHGDFHSGSDTVASVVGVNTFWIRHPTDFDLSGLGGEYGGYNFDGSTYSIIAPVASVDVSSVVSTGVLTGDKAIVTCISCHRAHGTPHDSLLRWDYKGWPASGSYNGCYVCHTTKL